MSPLTGLPDFGQPATVPGGYAVFPAAEEADRFLFVPDQLEVAPEERRPGVPDFHVELVRGQSPFLPPPPYGLFDFRVRPVPPRPEILAALRAPNPRAVLAPALPHAGWLRLQLIAGSDQAAAEFAEPVPLAANGLDALRLARRLSTDGVTLLKRVLQEGTLTFVATAELEIRGVAPRLACRLEFKPGELFAELRKLAGADDRLPRARLVDFWMQDIARLPVRPVSGFDGLSPALLAQGLADWTAAEFAAFAASPAGPVQATVQLRPPAEPDRAITWDLSQFRTVSRVFLLALDPFAAAQQVVAAQGIAAVLTETVVPPLQTGFVTISVAANLPPALEGVAKLGVSLVAPPRPPARVHPLTATLLLDNPDAVQTVPWRFAPDEEIAYEVTAFAMMPAPAASVR